MINCRCWNSLYVIQKQSVAFQHDMYLITCCFWKVWRSFYFLPNIFFGARVIKKICKELQMLKHIYLEEDSKYCKALFFVYGVIKIIKLIVMMHNVQLWKQEKTFFLISRYCFNLIDLIDLSKMEIFVYLSQNGHPDCISIHICSDVNWLLQHLVLITAHS